MAVLEPPTENGRRGDGITEDRFPFYNDPVCGYEHGATLIAAADELEEQMPGVWLNGFFSPA